MNHDFLQEKPWMEKLQIIFWFFLISGVVFVIFVLIRGQRLPVSPSNSYQAVFLDNEQVYFGKLRAAGRDFFSLRDVYYLRAGTVQVTASTTGENRIDLVKLGAELHAPGDKMLISKSHILFYEDISEEGEIMKLIRKHKQGQ